MAFKLLPVIEEGYWRNFFDSTVYMTHKGQFFKYFHQHIHQRKSTAWEGSFHLYTNLPAELQLHVVQHCDAPTLFQLMHTARDLRVKARKLFFSDPATWYRLDAKFLCEHRLATESVYETSFLASIKQLAICSQTLNSTAWSPTEQEVTFVSPKERSDFVNEHIKKEIQAFWRTVRRLCPQVKRIMFTKDGTPFPDKNMLTDCFQKMAQFCPQDLDVLLYSTESEAEAVGRRRKRELWRLRTSDQDMITEIILKREEYLTTPRTIVVPPHKPYRGRVGNFVKERTLFEKYHTQRCAAEYYRAAAVEQFYFQGRHQPFGCSVTDCDAWFDQPDQYTTHLLATGHGKGETAPGEAEALVTENTKHLLLLRQEQRSMSDIFWKWYGDYPSEQNTMAEREVIHQLEHDSLYAGKKPISEHALFEWIQEVWYTMAL